MPTVRPLTSCVLLGLAGGMRTFMPATAAGWHRRPQSPSTRVLTVLAAGELAFDKLPQAPSRLEPPGLAGRALSSAVAGATVSGPAGALTSLLTALPAARGTHDARRALGRLTGAPDWLLGAVEDVLAVALVAGAIRLAR